MCLYNFKSMVSIMRYVILLMTPIPYMDHSLVMVKGHSVQFSSFQLLSHVQLFATP